MTVDGLDTAGFNEAELALAAGFVRGEPVRTDGAEVRGSVIARVLCRPGAETGAWPRPVLRLIGARITGELDLSFVEVAHPLILEDCDVEQTPGFYWSRLNFVSFRNSRLPGLLAANATIDGHLRLLGARIDGEVNLKGAKITGGLLLNRAHLTVPGGMALDAERAEIGGDILAGSGFRMSGAMRLFQATIAGGVLMDGAVVEGGGEGSRYGVIAADSVEIRGGFSMRGAAVAGEISLRHGRIGGAVTLSGATLDNPDGVALRLDRAEVNAGVNLHDGCVITGETRMVSAQVGRTLRLRGGTFRNPGGFALLADGLALDGNLDGQELVAEGEVSIIEGRVTGPIKFEGASMSNPGGRSLRTTGIVAGSIMNCCDGFTATGRVSVTSAKVGSTLCFDGATLLGTPVALRVVRTEAGTLRMSFAEPPAGLVELRHTRIGLLRDARASWPAALDLDGVTYQTMEPLLPAAQRLEWLARAPGLPPQPYEQLAAHYRQAGDDAAARRVLHARQQRQRASGSWPSRAWGWLQDITVGYGYRPQRAAGWLAALLALGTIAFSLRPPVPITSPGPHFNALIYTLDLLLPVVSFGQETAFEPRGGQQWLAYVLIIAGWTLATTAAAGFTRAMSRS